MILFLFYLGKQSQEFPKQLRTLRNVYSAQAASNLRYMIVFL